MRLLTCIILLFSAGPVLADAVFAARTIRAQSVLTAQDLVVKKIDVAGAATAPGQIICQEARIAIYAGRPISPGDVGPPAIVERNQVVPLTYDSGGLSIAAEGRCLERAGVGEYVRVMNLASRNTVTGLVMADGRVRVSKR